MHTVLTIAGSDSSGGAGIQADLKTITMLNCFGMSAITALTAQNTTGVTDIHSVPAAFLQEQIQTTLSDIPADAIKIGMIADPEQVHAIVQGLTPYAAVPIVLDPVMIATSGASLTRQETVLKMKTLLFPMVTLITPNLPEAQALLGTTISNVKQMKQAAARLGEIYHTAILIKGGHLPEEPMDVLWHNGEITIYHGVHIVTRHTHGTGCTLSSAIAVYLAQGQSLEESVRLGKEYVTNAIRANPQLGHGCGPLGHNYRLKGLDQ